MLGNLNHLLFNDISEIPADIVGCVFFTLKVGLRSAIKHREKKKEEKKQKRRSVACCASDVKMLHL